jgi:hypothetical protein
MVAVAHSSHPKTVSIYYESTPGTPPADAAAWATAEGTSADRIRVTAIDSTFIRGQSSVRDMRLKDRIFGQDPPIKGLRTADGGSMEVVLHGSEAATTATEQVAETALMRQLEHTLGGLSRGYTSALSAVTSDTEFTLTTATGVDPGVFYALEDSDDTGRLFPVRALTEDTGEVTVDMDVPWTVSTSDLAHAVAVVYIDDQALMNPSDANASTISLLIEESIGAFQTAGGKLQLDSITLTRNEVPKIGYSIFSAYAEPFGDGAPSLPTWSGTVTGAAGLAIGADTKVFVQNVGTGTYAIYDVYGMSVTAGVPVVPLDTITEATDNMQGRAGYGTQPADTILELTVPIASAWVTKWLANQACVVRLFQVAPAGSGFFVHASRAILNESPEQGDGNETKIQTLRFVCHEDRTLDAVASNLDRARSKLILGLY